MRLVGTLPAGRPAGGLLALLAARGVEVRVREGGLWALDEADLPGARELLDAFRREPAHRRWQEALRAALGGHELERRQARGEQARRVRRAWRRERRVRRAFAAAPSSRPLTLGLLALGALLLALGGGDPATALPVLASCYWLHELGTQAEGLHGTRRFATRVLALAALPWAAAWAAGVPAGGLSGLAFGLLADTAVRAARDPESGLRVPAGLLSLMSAWMLACALGAAPEAVLLAQCAGLAAGLCTGLAGELTARGRRRLAGRATGARQLS